MKTIITNPLRIFQGAIGLSAVIAGSIERDGFLILCGSWILVMVIWNRSCCGTSYCVPTRKNNVEQEKEINYTEIK